MEDDFAALFERHYDAVRRYLVRRAGPALGEELAADTFVRALDGWRRFDPERGEPRAWLFGIAANLMRRHRRDEERRLRAYARTGIDPVLDALEDVDARVDASRRGRQLAAALAALPGREREPLLLYAWAELSYEEIAAALRLPLGTVRSRLSRGRARLRRELEPGAGQVPDDEGLAPLLSDAKGRLT